MSDHKAEPSKARFIPSANVRRWLYGVGVATAPVLVAYGLIEADTVPMWVTLAGAVFAVSNGVALGNVEDK